MKTHHTFKSSLISKSAIPLTLLFVTPFVSAATFMGNGNVGFGGVISALDITDDGTNISFVLTRGAGDLNDAFIIYIDSVAGGQTSTTQHTDSSDPLRAAISGFNGTDRSIVNFTLGFGVDRALALGQSFSGLWTPVDNGSHAFIATANPAPGGVAQSTYTMNVSIADLGISPGASFNFVGTYLNPNSFRSNEGIGDGLPADGNPGQNAVTFTNARSYTTVPEPTSAVLGLIGSLLLFRRRK